MITIRDFSINDGKVYITFLTNDMSISSVALSEEIANKNNNEIIDYLYSKINYLVTDWCIENFVDEDKDIEYIELDISGLTKSPKQLTLEEIKAINDENVRVMNLISNQKMQGTLMQANDEINRLKQLVSDLASIMLGV